MRKLNLLLLFTLMISIAGYSQFQISTPLTPLPTPAGTTLNLSVNTTQQPSGNGVVTLYYQGDFDGATETGDLFDENGVLLGTTASGVTQCSATLDSIKFPVTAANISNWVADGIVGFDLTPTGAVNPTLCGADNIQVKLEYPPLTGPNDASVVRVDSPRVFCQGSEDIYALIRNSGTNAINSVTINWEIDGVVQTPVSYTSTLAIPGGGGTSSASVFLGARTFGAAPVDIKVYTSNPNGVADSENRNDTVTDVLKAALAGNFTLNASLPASATNYTSFTSLANDLNANGICATTYVTVAPGVYNEVFNLASVPGLGAGSTLTIDGGDSSLVTLENNQATSSTIIGLDDISYTTIKNMTIRSTNTATADHFGVHFTNNSNNDSIVACKFEMNPTNTFGAYAIGASASASDNFAEGNNANFVTIINNTIEGGDYGIHFEGGATGSWNAGNQFINNTITSTDDYGMYFDQQDSLTLIGNNVSGLRTTSTFAGYGIASFDCMNFVCESNYIDASYTALYFSDANSDRIADAPARIVNNMLISRVNYGLWLTDAVKVNVFHNSVYCEAPADAAVYFQGGFSDSVDYRNNISSHASFLAFETTEPDVMFLEMDNNVYHTGTGTNLLEIDGTLYADLSAYQTANINLNAASLEGNPEFISTTDLHIVGGFVNDNGDNSVNVLEDIDGDSRPLNAGGTVDPGADEHDPPSCLPPTALAATNATLDSATISWTGTIGFYEYEVVPPGGVFGTFANRATTTSSSVRIGNLNSSSTYDFYVREVCGRGDSSVWIGPVSFNTSNGLPFFEDFETFVQGNDANPWTNGWSSTTTADPRWIANFRASPLFISGGTGPLVDNTTGTNQGYYIFMETSGGTAGATADFVSPSVFIDPTASTIELEYFYFMHGTNIDRMEVYVRSGGNDVLLTTITGQQQPNQTDPWLVDNQTLSGYAGQSIQIVFRGYNVACCTGDIAIDDVRLFEPLPVNAGISNILGPQLPICPGPTTPIVEVVNSGTQTLNNVSVVADINGILDTTLYSTPILSGATAAVTLSPFTAAAGISYDVKFYTIEPNGIADPDNTDDTLNIGILETGLLAGAYTIDSSAVTGGANYQSFEDFSNAVNNFGLCGSVTVDVVAGSGPYTDQRLILDEIPGSSAANTITINGNGQRLEYSATVSDERAAVLIDGTDYVTIDSLDIDVSAGTYGWGVHITGDANNISILNSDIASSISVTSFQWHGGIVISGSLTSMTTASTVENVTIDNNEVVGGYYTIAVTGTFNDNLDGIVITNNIVQDFYQYGMYINRTDSVLIEGNDISRPARTNTTTMYGIGMVTSNTNAIVNANAIHNTHDLITSTSNIYPIYVTGDIAVGEESYVTNNLIYNVNGNGLIYGIYDLGSNGFNYLNNTISLDVVSSTTNDLTRGFYQSAASSNSAFQNNIISISRGGSGDNHGIYLNNTGTTIAVDFNNVYMNSAGSGLQAYGFLGGDQINLLDWRNNTTYGLNSFDVDPIYNAPALDSLVPGAGQINAVALSSPFVTTDFYGVARTGNPDIGAIEFDPPPVPNPGVTALVSPVQSQDSCYSASDALVINLVNAGGIPLDFVNDPTTVTVNVTGANTQTITTTVNTNAVNGGAPVAVGLDVDINVGTIDLSFIGTYEIETIIDMVADNFPGNDTLRRTIVVDPVSGGTISGTDTICGGDTVTLVSNAYQGLLQWQELIGGVWTDIAGENSASLDVDPSVGTDYRALACGTVSSDTFNVFPVAVNIPTLVKNDPVVVTCGASGTDSLVVSVAPGSTANWFDQPIDGNLVTSGDTLLYTATTNPLGGTARDTFYVETNTSGTPERVGALDNTIGAGGNFVNINVQNLQFTVNTATTLISVYVYANGPGNVEILLNDAATGANVQSVIVPVTGAAAGERIVLNFPLTPGNYTMNGNSLTSGGLFRNSSGASYPYSTGSGSVVITGNSFAPAYYYFFYDWEVGGGCTSDRLRIIGEVDCLVGLEDGFANTEEFSIYPNPSEGQFTMNITTLARKDFNLTVRDVKGQEVFSDIINVNGAYTNDLDFTGFAKGVYYLQIQTEEESRVEKLIIQ